jgi:hypothetical protein
MVQICFRVPSDVADFIREMSIRNDRQPGAELARMIRPVIEAEKKRRAWEEQQQAPARVRVRGRDRACRHKEAPAGREARKGRRERRHGVVDELEHVGEQ